jgi:uncharacterized RDD family membrane protein YckC
VSNVDWDNYQVPLSPEPPRDPITSTRRAKGPPLAGRGDRLIAKAFDWLLLLAPLILAYIVQRAGLETADTPITRPENALLVTAGIAVAQGLLLTLRGQTFGKMIMGVRIVKHQDAANPGFFDAVVLRSLVPALIVAIPVVGQLLFVADCLCGLGEQRRCIHDLIAGTKVVENSAI